MRLTRRLLIPAAGAAALTTRARAQQDPPPLVIGVLTDQTGIGQSISGPPLVTAVRMATQDAGLMPDGRTIQVVTDSFQLKADDALAIARRWFDQGVVAITDVPGTTATLAVQEYARSRGRTVLTTGSVSPDLTGKACSPLGSTWVLDTGSMATALARTLVREGARTWFLIVPDSVLGLTMQADAVKAIGQAGGQVVGSSRHPRNNTDFTSIIAQAKASGAQAVGLCDVTQELSVQLGQLQDGGLFGEGRKVVAFLAPVADVHNAGAKAAQGLIVAAPFYWNQNDQSRLFANRFFAASGQMPDAVHAAAYVAVRHYLRAVVATDGADAALINQEMRRTPVYFFGRNGRLRLDGRLALDLSLLRVKPPEAMRGDWDHYEQIGTIPGADVFRPLSQTGCTLGL